MKKKQTILELKHNLGMAAILFFCIFLLGAFIAASINIYSGAEQTEKLTKTAFGTEVKFHVDQTKYASDNNVMDSGGYFLEGAIGWPDGPTLPIMEQIGGLQEVEYFDYSISAYLSSSALKRWSVQGNQIAEEDKTNNVEILGIGVPEIFDVRQDRATFKEGRPFTEAELEEGKDVVIISSDFAQLNKLTLGNKITLDNRVEIHHAMPLIFRYDEEGNELKDETTQPTFLGEQQVTLEIVGILDVTLQEANADDPYDNTPWINEDHVNRIYVPNKVAEREVLYEMNLLEKSDEGYTDAIQNRYEATYYLYDVNQVENFKKNAQPYLPQYYTLYAESDKYEEIAPTIAMMEKWAKLAIFIGSGLSLLLVSCILILWVHVRMPYITASVIHGQSKVQLAIRMIGEVLIIGLLAVSLGAFTGNIASQHVSQRIVENALVKEADYHSYEAVGEEPTAYTIIEKFDTTSTPQTFFAYYLIELFTLTVALLPAVVYIFKVKNERMEH